MRRIKTIRRRKLYFLNALFLASALLFYETHSGIFFKEFAGRKLQEMLPEGTRVDIGDVSGGVFKNLVSENVRIFLQEENGASLDVERVEIDYKLWYPLLEKFPVLRRDNEARKIVLFLGGRNKYFMSGFLELELAREKLGVLGYLNLDKRDKILVKGTIEENKPSRFRIIQKKGFIDLRIERKKDEFAIEGRINHIKFHDIDIIGECSASVDTGDSNFINAHIVFKNIITDYKPFDKTLELSLRYDKPRDILNISKFKIGKEIEGYGYVRPAPPHYVFLKWIIANLNLQEYFANQKIEKRISGIINGNFVLKGPIREADFSAHLDVQNGDIYGLKFDSIIAGLEGKGPSISIKSDSRIRREGSSSNLGGTIDLSRLKEQKAFEGICLEGAENFFTWDGWNVAKAYEDSSLVAEKYLDEDFRMSFKTYTEDKKREEEKHFFGVERKVKF